MGEGGREREKKRVIEAKRQRESDRERERDRVSKLVFYAQSTGAVISGRRDRVEMRRTKTMTEKRETDRERE